MFQNKAKSDCDSGLDGRLKRALRTGDVVAFKRLVKGGVNVNSTYWFNSTLLHEAVQIGSSEHVQFLLQHKANVDSKNKTHRTPLHIASRGGLYDIASLLVTFGADVNAKTLDNQTPLHVAAWRSKYEIVKLLVTSGADVNVKDKDGWLAIHWVLRHNNEEMVEYLINAGSLIDCAAGKVKTSPFLNALLEQKYGLVKLLLTHGAEDSLRKQARYTLDTVLKDKSMKLSVHNKLNMVSFLVKSGLVIQPCDLMGFSDTLSKDDEKQIALSLYSGINLSLTNMCRLAIRDHIKHLPHCQGKTIYSTIKKLPIPKLLIQYVSYTDDYFDGGKG